MGVAEDRDSLLYGCIAAGAAFVLVLAALFLMPVVGKPSFDAVQLTALVGLVVIALWLLGASAPWADDDPFYARALRKTALVPFLGALALLMLFVRILGKDVLFSGGGLPLGNDPDDIYHYREMIGIVHAFPSIPRFDPWTFYPHGTLTGQFGTLYDWLLAAGIVLVHGRNASDLTIATWLAWWPVVLGSLLIVPFYFLARRLFGRSGAIVACITLALLPGDLLYRSVIGSADHDVAQDFFGVLAMLGMVIAVERVHAARDAYHARDWRRMMPSALWAVLGGIVFAANLYVWPPGILFVVIVAIWLGIVTLVKDARGEDSLGYVAGGSIALVTCGLLMLPILESSSLGEFTTFSLLHPVACFLTAAVLIAIHALGRFFRARGAKAWAVPLATVGLGLAGIVALFTLPFEFLGSIRWGFSWVSGIGVLRTMTTISEARSASIFCDPATDASCLVQNYGPLVQVGVIFLIVVIGWALWRHRSSDILLVVWSVMIFQATLTQAHFAHYLALNLALLTGWVSARVAEGTSFERVPGTDEAKPAESAALKAKPGKAAKGGRKTQRAAARAVDPTPLKALAVAAVLLVVLPGNVFATSSASPGWLVAKGAASPGELWFWQPSLEWMRDNTPSAGVDLTTIYPSPSAGHDPTYPASSYGVLTWWDYGFYIETIAKRPPVANPFQQAAPFAATWFTERDPATAEKLLDDWVGSAPPVRYVMIDNEIGVPFSKFGAITVWANSVNGSRPPLVDPGNGHIDPAWVSSGTFDGPDGPKTFQQSSSLFTDSMMGRLYDANGVGLSHYRMVWQMRGFQVLGDASDTSGNFGCLEGTLDGNGGCVSVDVQTGVNVAPGTYVKSGNGYAYNVHVVSPLVVFERVKGAHLQGTATPGATVTVECRVQTQPEFGFTFDESVTGVAGPDGKYDIVFPYSNTAPVTIADGGTNTSAKVTGPILVSWPGGQHTVDVPDAAVLHGDVVAVPSV